MLILKCWNRDLINKSSFFSEVEPILKVPIGNSGFILEIGSIQQKGVTKLLRFGPIGSVIVPHRRITTRNYGSVFGN